MSTSGATLDPDALRARYRAERDKRLRGDGNAQYVTLTDRWRDGVPRCTGYYNNEGKVSPQARQNFFFMGGPLELVELLDRWRADGRMDGLALDLGPPA